uniref:Uncharacterized protein ycf33 n=1 Tax=Halydictyon mirabile TaxID=189652 RepID=A0A4D6WU40_9FLOR|nr:hypothetical protein [Halydictyon mirabile]
MYNFWNNVYKFPRFLIGFILGFFLTTFRPTFKLLKDKKSIIILIIIIYATVRTTYLTLELMINGN